MRSLRIAGWRICCVVLMLLSAVAGANAQDAAPPSAPKADLPGAPDAAPLDKTRPDRPVVSSATAVLRVTCSPESGLCNPALIEDLVKAGQTVGALRIQFSNDYGKEALQAADDSGGLFEISLQPERFTGPTANKPEGVYMGEIAVRSFDKRMSALWILQNLPTYLRIDLEEIEGSREQDAVRSHLLQQEALELQKKTSNEAESIRHYEAQHGLNFSKTVIEQRSLQLDAELRSAQVRVSELEALRTSLQKRIAELGPKLVDAAQNDPVIVELAKVVRLREEAHAKIAKLAAGGQSASANVQESEESLAHARAEHAKQVRMANQEAGGLRLVELQRRLEDTEIELQETTVKAEQLSLMYAKLNQSSQASGEIENRKAMLDIYRKGIAKINSELLDGQLKRHFRVAPSVKMIAIRLDGEKK